MPTNFKCNGCDLRFAIGWYHHHGAQSGFRASTLTVCAHCGAQHRIQQARDFSRWPAARREATPPPPQEQDHLLVDDLPADASQPSRLLDIVGPRTGPTGFFQLDQQACGKCAAVGTLLTSEAQAPSACPQCGSLIEVVGSWLT